MKRRRWVAALAALLLLLCLTGCASEVFGEWVTEDGQVYNFGNNTLTINGSEEYPYKTESGGIIHILFSTDMFGSETSYQMDGTYEVQGNTLYLTIGSSTSLVLTRY